MSTRSEKVRSIVISTGWSWRPLFLADEDAFRICLFGILVVIWRRNPAPSERS